MKLSCTTFRLALYCFAVTVFAIPGFAQDDDPFKSSKAKVKTDPFEERRQQDAEKVRAAERRVKAMEQGEVIKLLSRNNAELKAQLDKATTQYKYATQDYEHRFQNYEQALGRLNQTISLLRERTTLDAPAHDALIRSLITSGETSQQRNVMQYLVQLSQQNDPDGPKAVSLDSNSLNTLKKLLESGDRVVQKLAAQTIAHYDPNAIKAGFQPRSDRWLPMPTGNEKVDQIRSALGKRCKFDYFETRLDDIIAELQSDYRMEIHATGGVDIETLVTFVAQDRQLGTTLQQLLAKHELTYRVTDDHLTILPINDPNAVTSLTWNVRGLLTGSMDIDALVSLLNTRFETQAQNIKLDTLDSYRLLTIAKESQQEEISRFLATLAPAR